MKTKKKWIVAAAVVMFILALGVTIYPLLANYYNARHQSEIRTAYQEQVEKTNDGELTEAWTLAAQYNETIKPGAHEAGAFSQDALLTASEGYDALLNVAGNGIMGYIEIPKIDVSLPIYHGTDAKTLEVGVGHLLGTSLPVGGDGTHAVLSGHSGMAAQKMFSDLGNLAVGDVFYLNILGETLAYRVDQIRTVLPYETEELRSIAGKDLCTLSTCTPFGVNSHRLLVRGIRIPYEEAAQIEEQTVSDGTQTTSTWEQQYMKGIVGGIAISALLLAATFVICWKRRHKQCSEKD